MVIQRVKNNAGFVFDKSVGSNSTAEFEKKSRVWSSAITTITSPRNASRELSRPGNAG